MTDELADLREFNERITRECGSDEAVKRAPEGVKVCDPPLTADPKMDSIMYRAKLWAVAGDGYFPCEETVQELPPAHYTIEQCQTGVFFKLHNLKIDNLLELPDSASEKVIAEIQKFWTLEQHFREYGFLWKRGILLWGPPGSGKTSTVQIVTQRIIKNGGIAVSIYNPRLSAVGMYLLRKIEPKRPVVAIIEDIDAIINNFGESEMLALLDGEQQVDNVVYIATTNYPERLDPRFVNRPSRFDTIQKIGMPSTAAREVYLKAKSKILSENDRILEQWVEDTGGFSVAHLKELIISVEVFDVPYKDAIARLRTMMECEASSLEFNNKKMGFSPQ